MRRPIILASLAGVVLLAAAALGWWFLQRPPHAAPAASLAQAHYVGTAGLRAVPSRAARRMARLAAPARDAARNAGERAGRLQRCALHLCGRDLDLLPARREVFRAHRREGRQARRLRGEVHLRCRAAAAVPGRVSGRAHPGPVDRLGRTPEVARRTALVSPVSEGAHHPHRSAALDARHRRTGTSCARSAIPPTSTRTTTPPPTPSRPPGRRSASAARPVTVRARRTWTGRATKAAHPTKALPCVSTSAQERTGRSMRRPAMPSAARRARRRKEIETCALCHARRGQIWEGHVPGRPLADTHEPALLSAGLYEADGQMRDEVYNYGSFLQSRMYQQGVTCADCHDPHSGKLRAPGNGVCFQCHSAEKYGGQAHTGHPLDARAAPAARPATCRCATTWSSIPATTTASACRGPISA